MSMDRDKQIKKRNRQRYFPFAIMIIAAVLLGVGIVFGILWMTGAEADFSFNLKRATSTPYPTVTPVIEMTRVSTNTALPTAVPSITPTFGPSPTALAPFPYVVEEGDTIYTLSEKFGLNPTNGHEMIMLLNNMGGSTYISVGTTIIIPDPNTTLPTATPLPADLAVGTLIDYTVMPGDLLSAIAAEYYSTIDDILKANNIADANLIQPNQVLKIPIFTAGTPSPDEPTQEVVTTQSLVATVDPNVTATSLPSDLPTGTIVQYTVQEGDILVLIAEEFYSTLDEILEINGIDDPSLIFVGQVLDVPVFTNGRPE